MYRLIVYILVFTLFSSGMLWAADAHVNDMHSAANHTIGVTNTADRSNTLDDTHPKPGGHHASHDCHLFAHLTALGSLAASLLILSSRSENFPHNFTSLVSHHSAPPGKPPKI